MELKSFTFHASACMKHSCFDLEYWNTLDLDRRDSDNRKSNLAISTSRTSPPRSTGRQKDHQIFGTFLNQTLVNLLSSSTSWFICLHSRCSLVKPVDTVQPESCSLGSVNWCWSGISSQIPRSQYSCCDSNLSFDLLFSALSYGPAVGSRSNSPLPVLCWDRLMGPSMRYSCLIVAPCDFSYGTNP